MPTFDGQRFVPPAPIALVTLRNSLNELSATDVPMLIDTGADVTLLPKVVIEQLGVKSDNGGRYEVAGFDGHRCALRAVQLDMTCQDTMIRGQYLIINDAIGVLGRDVLNFFVLVIDGSGLQWTATRRSEQS
jgi:hypothetical protein